MLVIRSNMAFLIPGVFDQVLGVTEHISRLDIANLTRLVTREEVVYLANICL